MNFFNGASTATIALIGSLICSGMVSAQVIKPAEDEKERLQACEKNICTAALTKLDSGDMTCSIQKTWTKSYIEDGVRQKKITWTFGDAQCSVDVKIPNSDIAAAVSQPKHTVQFEEHAVTCNIERESEMTQVNLKMAPKLEFSEGKVQKAWLNVASIDAPTLIKGAIWTVATLEDNFGLFHSELVSEVNEFLGEKCPKRYPELVKN